MLRGSQGQISLNSPFRQVEVGYFDPEAKLMPASTTVSLWEPVAHLALVIPTTTLASLHHHRQLKEHSYLTPPTEQAQITHTSQRNSVPA